MNDSYISYSKILIKFIDPIITGAETENELLLKAKIGMIAWNFNLSNYYEIPYKEETALILNEVTKENSDGRKILNSLVLRKEAEFSDYNQLITKVEINIKSDASKRLYVESIPVDKVANNESK